MTTLNPPCTSTTNLGKVLISIIPLCEVNPKMYVPTAGEAAGIYAETQIMPIVDQITKNLQDVGFFLLFLIIFLVVFPVICIFIWVGLEIKVSAKYIIIGVCGILLILGILGFIVYTRLRNSVTNQLTGAVGNVSNLFKDPATTTLIVDILIKAAIVYLTTTP